MTDEFTCAACDGVFTQAWSDEEAQAEADAAYGDHDPAGINAAKQCRQRWKNAGMECRIIVPHQQGTDFNDAAGSA